MLRSADGADANALQAPLQYRLPDWDLGSTGCFDQASLKGLQDALADLDSRPRVYRKNWTAFWLVLYTRSIGTSESCIARP